MVLPLLKALLSAQPQEPLREPQPELLQAFITQSAEQPSEILRHLLQFRPTACVVHSEGSYAAERLMPVVCGERQRKKATRISPSGLDACFGYSVNSHLSGMLLLPFFGDAPVDTQHQGFAETIGCLLAMGRIAKGHDQDGSGQPAASGQHFRIGAVHRSRGSR